MRVTEREAGAEGVVDIENLQPARLHGRAELIEQSRGEPRRLGLARRVRLHRCTEMSSASLLQVI
jgi:hypothetical protein